VVGSKSGSKGNSSDVGSVPTKSFKIYFFCFYFYSWWL